MLGKKYKEIYNGKLDERKELAIEVNGGNFVLSDGNPYLVAKSRKEDGLRLKKTPGTLTIYGEDCSLEISYPKDTPLNIKVNGSALKLHGMSPKDYLKMALRGANAELDSIDISKADTDMKLSGANVSGSIVLRDDAKSNLNVDVNGGTFDLGLHLPKGAGISTTLVGSAIGSISVPESKEGKNGNLKLKISCIGGVVKIKE